MDRELQARASALVEHNPPAADIWLDAEGQLHLRCVTRDPNPDCPGCQETTLPTGEYLRYTPFDRGLYPRHVPDPVPDSKPITHT